MNWIAHKLITMGLRMVNKKYKETDPVSIHSDAEGRGFTIRFAPVGAEPETVKVTSEFSTEGKSIHALKELQKDLDKAELASHGFYSHQVSMVQHAINRAQTSESRRSSQM